MAEPIGVTLAVVGITGQIVQGIQVIKNILSDIKDAPDYIQNLQYELELIVRSAKYASHLATRLDSRRLKFEIEPALTQCDRAVQELRRRIGDPKYVLEMRKGSKVVRVLRRLKFANGKQQMKESIEALSRSAVLLLSVQANISIEVSIDIHEVVQHSAVKIDRMPKRIQSLSKDLMLATDTLTRLNDKCATALLDVRTNSIEQSGVLCEVGDAWKEPYTGPTRALDGNLSIRPEPAFHKDGYTNSYSESTVLRGTSKECIKTPYTLENHRIYDILFCSIWLSSENLPQSKGGNADSVVSGIRRLNIHIKLGLWRKGFVVEQHNPGHELRLIPFHIIKDTSPILDACYHFDIERAKTLLSSGQASIFDQDTFRRSLFDSTFYAMCETRYDQAGRGLEMLKFLIHQGVRPASMAYELSRYKLSWIEEVMAYREEGSCNEKTRQAFADAIRLVLEYSPHDPFGRWDIGPYIGIRSSENALGQCLAQQDRWPVNLQPGIRERNRWVGIFVENDRQILDDPTASHLLHALAEGKQKYFAISSILPGRMPAHGLHSILFLYQKSKFKSRLREGCKNRLVVLLTAGFDPRSVARVHTTRASNRRRLSVTEFSIHTQTLDIWREALLEASLAGIDIEDLIEEDYYCGVSALMGGELNFVTLNETRNRFLHTLSTGSFRNADPDSDIEENSKNLGWQLDLHWFDGKLTVEKAEQAFSLLAIPGSYPLEDSSELIFGTDFYLYDIFGKKFASFEAYEACWRWGGAQNGWPWPSSGLSL